MGMCTAEKNNRSNAQRSTFEWNKQKKINISVYIKHWTEKNNKFSVGNNGKFLFETWVSSMPFNISNCKIQYLLDANADMLHIYALLCRNRCSHAIENLWQYGSKLKFCCLNHYFVIAVVRNVKYLTLVLRRFSEHSTNKQRKKTQFLKLITNVGARGS